MDGSEKVKDEDIQASRRTSGEHQRTTESSTKLVASPRQLYSFLGKC